MRLEGEGGAVARGTRTAGKRRRPRGPSVLGRGGGVAPRPRPGEEWLPLQTAPIRRGHQQQLQHRRPRARVMSSSSSYSPPKASVLGTARSAACLLLVAAGRGEAGLLRVGTPLPWGQAMPHLGYVRDHGVKQFVSRYRKVEGIENDELKWGDELEYAILKVDHANKRVRVSTRAADVVKELQTREDEHAYRSEGCQWMPEYGSWMLEGTPKVPLRGLTTHLARVERNMRLRRKRLLATLADDEISPTMTNFPLFGVGDFTTPPAEVGGPTAQSKFVPDSVINPHPRFAALTKNIRERRGRKVDIQIPLYKDERTPEFLVGPPPTEGTEPPPRPTIHMDAMAFGMGCCCLQVTFQARDIEESRYMFDQLAVVSPIMLALSAATPIHRRGRLADTDVRWDTISASVDDRTEDEMRPTEEPLLGELDVGEFLKDDENGPRPQRQPKSRYDSISTFIYNCRTGTDRCRVVNKYNDIDCPVDEPSRKALLKTGIDSALSKHIAHLFSRDPLVIFEGRIEEVDDDTEVDHFENLQSTNWQTVRWKPPPPRLSPNDPHVGWRTEFRSLEIQLTDFENAAYTVFIVLVTRVILALDLNLYIPLSKVDENMRRAHERDAATKGKFFFRSNIDYAQSPEGGEAGEIYSPCDNDPQSGLEEMTVLQILEGKGDFPGLIPLVHAYLEYINADSSTIKDVDVYLDHLRKRAAGEIMTTAAWLRKFVTSHPGYGKDSVVTDEIAYDLVQACQEIGLGKLACPELLGDRTIREVTRDEAWDVVLDSSKMEVQYRNRLIKKFVKRAAEKQQARDAQQQGGVGAAPAAAAATVNGAHPGEGDSLADGHPASPATSPTTSVSVGNANQL
ncbi:unnamed protein product [Ectocarpus sp. 4 AP-2014]